MSWNLSKGEDFLLDVPLSEIKKIYKTEKKAKPKQRLLCAVHRKEGRSIDYIADALHMSRRTVHDTLTRFDKRGIKAKDAIKQDGRPALISLNQRKALLKDLEAGPPHNKSGLWTTKEVKDLLERKYGVSFVNQHIWRIIVSLGFTMQKPRKKHHLSATNAEIEAFKKTQSRKQDITERKALSWAQKMRPHLA
jgi:transposase